MKRKQLKVPKNPRKYNIWDSDSLNSTAQKAIQLIHNIEEVSQETNTFIHELPPSRMPMELVYEVCEAYISIYNKLLRENLIITANPESNNNLH